MTSATTTNPTDCSSLTVKHAATVTGLTVNGTLTTTTAVQLNQNATVTVDRLVTAKPLHIGTTTTAPDAAVLEVLPPPGALSIAAAAIVCAATTTSIGSGNTFAPSGGITTTASFPLTGLGFTHGMLTDVSGQRAVMTINTANVSTGSSDDRSFALPLVPSGTYSFTVNWGDGSSSSARITSYNQPDVVHAYAVAGSYTLEITGVLTGWAFAGGGDRLKLLNISAWGDLALDDAAGTLNNYFQDCANLNISAATGSPLRAGSATSLEGCFSGCTTLNADLSSWDTSSVTTMKRMFFGAESFNNGDAGNTGATPLAWTTSALLVDVSEMFRGCVAFNQTVTFSDTTNITSLASMFQGATLFNNGDPANGGSRSLSLTTPSLQYASSVFEGCVAFNQTVTFSNLAVLVKADAMFSGATLFNNGNPGNTGGHDLEFTTTTAALTDVSAMFYNGAAFNQTVTFGSTASVTTFFQMFANAALFNNGDTANVSGKPLTFLTTTALLTTSRMFAGCSSFNQPLALSTTAGVMNMSFMFQNAVVFNHAVAFDDTSSVTTMNSMFSGATAFNNGELTNTGAASLSLNTNNARSLDDMFKQATSFNQTLVLTDTSKATMSQMFFAASSFNNGGGVQPLTWNTAAAWSFSAMFYYTSAFNQQVAFTNTSNVLYMSSMFALARNFNNGGVPLEFDNTSKLIDTSDMFQQCVSFNQEVNFPDMTHLQTATSMFQGCRSFNNGDVTDASSKPLVWTTSALQTVDTMFKNCVAFNQPLTFSDMSNVTTLLTTLQNCNAFKQDLSAWRPSLCTTLSGFYTGDMNQPDSATNQNNYNALLNAWAAMPLLQTGVRFDMGTTRYSDSIAGTARAVLTGTWGWTIYDGGAAP